MNDNQKKNKSDDSETQREPLTKRVAKFSAFIYLGLAITVVIVATVGIFSISYDYETSLPPVSFPDLGENSNDLSIPDIDIEPDVSDNPVGGEESNVDADISEPEPDNRVMFYRPVQGEIIKPYSMDALVFSETMNDYRVHSGIDIAAELGTDVISFSDGVVVAVNDDYFYGTTVAVEHEHGAVSYYMNLDTVLADGIAVGAELLAGQKIGTVGNTARIESADAPHLHFELRINDELVDPETELP